MANGSSLKCLLYPTHLLGAKGNKFLAEILINRWQWAETLCNPLFFPLLFFFLDVGLSNLLCKRKHFFLEKIFIRSFSKFGSAVQGSLSFLFPHFFWYVTVPLVTRWRKKKFSWFRATT